MIVVQSRACIRTEHAVVGKRDAQQSTWVDLLERKFTPMRETRCHYCRHGIIDLGFDRLLIVAGCEARCMLCCRLRRGGRIYSLCWCGIVLIKGACESAFSTSQSSLH